MLTALKSSTLALAAAAWLLAPIASAHLQAPTAFAPLNTSRDYNHVFGSPPRHGAAIDVSRSLSGARSDRQAPAIRVELIRIQQPSIEISNLTALLGGKFRWIPAPIFDVFDAFQFDFFDPRTGDYGVYAETDPGTSRGSVLR